MKRVLIFIFAGGLGLTATRVQAQEVGAAFLKIGAGARAAALGNAYTAMAGNDVNALYWNPAGLGTLKQKEFSFTHAQWLLGSQYNFAAAGLPVDGASFGMDDYRGSIGMGVMGISVDGIDSRAADRTAQSNIDASDRAFLLGAGIRHRPTGLNFGLGVKFIQSSIGDHSAQTYALDLGMTYKMSMSRGQPLSVGLSVRNLGPGVQFIEQRDPLPTTASLGLSYPMGNIFNLAFDTNYHVHENKMSFGLGTEVTPIHSVALRAGYLQNTTSGSGTSGLVGLGSLAGGIGLKFTRYQVDYTFTPFGALGNAQRISLGARF